MTYEKFQVLVNAMQAQNEGKEVFIFEGSEVLTDYAKYVIQYFESKMGDLKI
jgi:hypothetical protein